MMSSRFGLRFRLVFWGMLILLLLWGVYSYSSALSSAEAAQTQLNNALDAGLAVAEVRRASDLTRVIRESATLRSQLVTLEEKLGAKTTPDSVIKWRTERIPVLMETQCTDPETSEPDATDWWSFEVVGREARVKTIEGNLFAVGEVELWRRDPDVLLGVSPWSVEVDGFLRGQPVGGAASSLLLGAGIGLVDGELAVGPLVVGRSVRILGWRLRPYGSVLLGKTYAISGGILFGR